MGKTVSEIYLPFFVDSEKVVLLIFVKFLLSVQSVWQTECLHNSQDNLVKDVYFICRWRSQGKRI